MKVAIIKYNAGNVRSVLFALERVGVEAVVTDDFDAIRRADRVIFPGVGEASSAMAYLRERGLDRLICSLTQPVLGICLGMQLMCARSEEGDTACLGLFDQEVKRFPSGVPQCKVPQIGWNNIDHLQSALLRGIPEGRPAHDSADRLHLPIQLGLASGQFLRRAVPPGKVGRVWAKNLIQLPL